MKDIKRIFEYHGAEHKVIFAFEKGEELTIENAKKYKTFHPRCGTSFIIFVMLISILVFSILGKPSMTVRIISRILFLPIIAGISYELIHLSGKYGNNPFVKIFVKPGLWLQRITTKEPDDSQLEVSIQSLKAALKDV